MPVVVNQVHPDPDSSSSVIRSESYFLSTKLIVDALVIAFNEHHTSSVTDDMRDRISQSVIQIITGRLKAWDGQSNRWDPVVSCGVYSEVNPNLEACTTQRDREGGQTLSTYR
jgi:hypothetical protein